MWCDGISCWNVNENSALPKRTRDGARQKKQIPCRSSEWLAKHETELMSYKRRQNGGHESNSLGACVTGL